MTSSPVRGVPLAHAEGVGPFARFLSDRDLSPARWLQEADISLHELRRPDGVVSLYSCYRFLDAIVRDERDFSLPVRVSETVSPLDLGTFGRALRRAGTVGDYLRMGSRLASTLSNSGIVIELQQEGEQLRVSQRLAPAPGYGPAIVDVYTLAVTLRFLRSVFGKPWRPDVVELSAGSESFVEGEDIRASDCILTGRGRTSFTLPMSLLEHPLPAFSATAMLPLTSEAAVIPVAFLEVMERLVCSGLEDGRTDVGSIARVAGMSVRALQRCLARCGTDYRTLLNRCRIRRASEWLASSDKSVADIGADLGYTDASNFARAYRRSTGYAPGEWRQLSRIRRDAEARRLAPVAVFDRGIRHCSRKTRLLP